VLRRRKSVVGPPGEAAAVDRSLCVSAIAMLGAIATAVAERTMDDDAAEKYLVESRRWLIREGLSGALSPGEKAVLAKPMADWTAAELAMAGRRNEAMGVLLWALGAIDELPPYDAPFEPLPAFVPLLAATAEFRAAARLRSPEDIERARAVAELWDWRAGPIARAESAVPRGASRDPGEISRQAAALAAADASAPAAIDGDFPAHGKALGALDADELAGIAETAAERHHALDWLAGRAADWDEAPTHG
jgi:hypothetical protein